MTRDPEAIGRFRVLRSLGTGAMGAVYLANDPVLKRRVAVKIVRVAGAGIADARERFAREAEISARLNHPNVITVYDVGEDPSWGPFLAIEFVDGSTLAEHIRAGGLDDVNRLRSLILAMHGLEAAHQAGIVHRDVKPSNLMIGRDGRVKLMDFGVARDDDDGATRTGAVIGTPAYISPEQLNGAWPSAATDRYAFAVTAFELFTGKRPFNAGTTSAIFYRIANDPPEFPESMPAALRPVFVRALSKNASARPPTLRAFLEQLIAATEIDDSQRARLRVLLEAAATPTEASRPPAPTAGSEAETAVAARFEEGGDPDRAITDRQQAAEAAARRHAHAEAIAHLERAIALTGSLTDPADRIRRESTLLVKLGSSFVASKGYAAPEAGGCYTRALDLCRRAEKSAALFPTIWGLQNYYQVRGELAESLKLARRLLEIAERADDSALRFQAHYAAGDVLFFCGQIARSRSHLERAMSFHRAERDHAVAGDYGGHESGVSMLGFLANQSWMLGYPDRGLTELARAHSAATGLGDGVSPIFALIHSSFHYVFRREAAKALRQSERLLGLCTEVESPYFRALGSAIRGWAIAERGATTDGILQIQQGLSALRATGAELDRPLILVLLAEALSRIGRFGEALQALDEASEASRRFGTPTFLWEPELHRVKGEALLGLSEEKRDEAESCLRQAIGVARKQRARPLELRAATSLARRFGERRGEKGARSPLRKIYRWFGEGFDTADLKEAKRALSE